MKRGAVSLSRCRVVRGIKSRGLFSNAPSCDMPIGKKWSEFRWILRRMRRYLCAVPRATRGIAGASCGASGIQRPLSARGLDFTTNDFDFGSSFRARGTAGNEREGVMWLRCDRRATTRRRFFNRGTDRFLSPQFADIGSEFSDESRCCIATELEERMSADFTLTTDYPEQLCSPLLSDS